MDHSTLGLLWGMMVIVAIMAPSGVFEYIAVMTYEQVGA